MALEWNPDFLKDLESGKYAWVAYLVCPECGATWRGILRGERTYNGIEPYGPIEEECPDCEMEGDAP